MDKNPLGFWLHKANQRIFLNSLAKKLSIKYPSDWGRITAREIIENGGGSLLKHFGWSSPKMLQSVYAGSNQ